MKKFGRRIVNGIPDVADIGASGRVDQVRLQIRLARIGRRYQHDLPRSRHGGSERFRLFQIAFHDFDPAARSWPQGRISTMREVTIGVTYSGWPNSRCVPRPMNRYFNIEPPQVEP